MDNSKIIEKCRDLGAFQCGIIPAADVPFDLEVVKMCEANRCGNYGRSWTCPPGVGTPEECKARCLKYKNVIVFSTKHELEDSFDFEGMTEGRIKHKEISKNIRESLQKDLGDMLVLSSEGCDNCKECAYPNPCRFPDRMFPSVESHGIMVYKEAAVCGINYINGANTVTYFSNIFFN